MGVILSTGDPQKDGELLAAARKETLVNSESFDDARKKERAANLASAKQPDEDGASGNALTDHPHVEGQIIGFTPDDEPKEAKLAEKSDKPLGAKESTVLTPRFNSGI